MADRLQVDPNDPKNLKTKKEIGVKDYILPYTGDEVYSLLQKIDKNEKKFYQHNILFNDDWYKTWGCLSFIDKNPTPYTTMQKLVEFFKQNHPRSNPVNAQLLIGEDKKITLYVYGLEGNSGLKVLCYNKDWVLYQTDISFFSKFVDTVVEIQ